MSTMDTEQFYVIQARPRLSGSRVGAIVGVEPGVIVDFAANPLGPQPARLAGSLSEETIRAAHAGNLPVLLVFENNDPSRPVIIDVVVDRPAVVTEQPVLPKVGPHVTVPPAVPSRADGLTVLLGRIVGIEADVVMVEGMGAVAGPTLAARTAITLRNLRDPVVLLGFADGSCVIVGQVYPHVPVEPQGGAGADVLLKGTRVRIEADLELVLAAGGCSIQLDARGKALTTADQIVSRARGANKVQGGTVQLN